MKKKLEIAFAITLVLISVLSMFDKIEIVKNIIYVIIIPSFLLSIISFISDIQNSCRQSAKSLTETYSKIGDIKSETVDLHIKEYETGTYKLPYSENLVPKDIYDILVESLSAKETAIQYQNIQLFCFKLEKVLKNLTIFIYVILFLSLIFAPYIFTILSNLNLNSIALWSLTLLFIALELKNEFAEKTFSLLVRIFCKKRDE